MSDLSSAKCPQCGALLPEHAPAGLCPGCLMALNLKADTAFTDDAATAAAPLPPSEIAPHFPQLEILECLGRGGMGVVYKARQRTLNRIVALKLLAPERVRDTKFAERFAREAQALAALNHPNIVTVYDFGQAGGYYFLLMEFVDGMNLRQLLRARKFMPEEALAIVPRLCEALQFAHDHGIVHRDIKPENLLLDKAGRVKIADFGIAKILGSGKEAAAEGTASPDNATQAALGTPHYMAPEQKTNPQTVDHRADIFSLGVVFYEMLTGELPVGQFAPPSTRTPGVAVDVRLDEVVLRALEKEPERRYQKVSEVKTAMDAIAAAPSGSAKPGQSAPSMPGTQPQPFNPDDFARDVLARNCDLDIGRCISRGWTLVLSNFWGAIGVTFLVAVLTYLPIVSLFSGPLMGGLFLYFLKKSRGEAADVGTVFSGFGPSFLNLFLAGFITWWLIFLGFVCLLVPGIYLLVAWKFSLALVIDKPLDFWRAMELSRRVIAKHWWKFWGFVLLLWFLKFLGSALFIIGGLIIAPVGLAALMYAYEDIFGPATRAGAIAADPARAASSTRPAASRTSPWAWAAAILAIGMFMLALLLVPLGVYRLTKAGKLTAHPGEFSFNLSTNPSANGFGTPINSAEWDTLPPVIVETQPQSGAQDVPGGMVKIRATFSKEMTTNSWTWATAWSNSVPEIIGTPHYEKDQRTCVLEVKLEPDKTYAMWLNSEDAAGFTDHDGHPAVPYLLIFQTAATTNQIKQNKPNP